MSARLIVEGAAALRFAPHVRFRFDETRQRWTVLAPEKLLLPDEQAVAILQLLDGARTVDEVIDELCRRYDAPREVVGSDVVAMLQDLADKGVLAS
jgi:pyrroloquinoline quinone biosynthesis protein D